MMQSFGHHIHFTHTLYNNDISMTIIMIIVSQTIIFLVFFPDKAVLFLIKHVKFLKLEDTVAVIVGMVIKVNLRKRTTLSGKKN